MSSASGQQGTERVFLRKASGLIKSASNTDVFIFDIGLVSVGIGLGGLLLYGPGVYMGSNLYISVILAGVAMMLIGLGMLCWTVTIPRSGGVYVFASRSMWPPLAFAISFAEASAWLFYSAFAAYYVTTLGIAPAVTTIGIVTHSSGLLTAGTDLASKGWIFGIGTALELIGAWRHAPILPFTEDRIRGCPGRDLDSDWCTGGVEPRELHPHVQHPHGAAP
jgi:hypothetical protein